MNAKLFLLTFSAFFYCQLMMYTVMKYIKNRIMAKL